MPCRAAEVSIKRKNGSVMNNASPPLLITPPGDIAPFSAPAVNEIAADIFHLFVIKIKNGICQ